MADQATCDAIVTGSPEELMKLLDEYRDKNIPDLATNLCGWTSILVMLDLKMPKVNGLDATRQIRELPGHRETPIIAMTANAFVEDKARCFDAGMTDFLVKPFDPDTLFATLLRSLSRR